MATKFDPEQQLRKPDATKGDILVNNGTKWTPLAPGSDGEVLTADSGEAAGLAWGSGAGLGDPGGNGIVVRTSINTTTNRSIAAGSSKLSVTNGDGVSGNPTLDVVEADVLLQNLGGTLTVAKGGTGATTQTAAMDALSPTTTKGDLLVDNGTNVIRLPVGSNTQILEADSAQAAGVKWAAKPAGEANTASNIGTAGVGVFKQKTSVDLEFKKINAGSSKVTITDDTGNNEVDVDVVEANLTLDNLGGTLAISKGGTGQTGQTAAFDALAPTTTKGDVIVHNGSDNIRKAVGADGQALVSRSSDASGVAWETISGTVPSGSQGQKLSFGASDVLAARDWIVLAEDYGAVGDGVTDDSGAILSALNAVAGTGRTLWLQKTYKISSELSVTTGDFVLDGGGTLNFHRSAATTGAMLKFVGVFSGASTGANETFAEASRSFSSNPDIDVDSATGFTVGDYVELRFSATHYSQISRIRAIVSDNLEFDDPILIPMDATFADGVREMAPIFDITVRNLTLDGTNTSAADSGTHGISIEKGVRLHFENLKIQNFTKGAGLVTSFGYQNYYKDIRLENCGDGSFSDLHTFQDSNSIWETILSLDASGFGPQAVRAAQIQGSNITVSGAAQRGMKIQNIGWGNWSNIICNNSSTTGLGITERSYRNQIRNVIANGNGDEGVWFSDQDNQYNLIDGIEAFDNNIDGTVTGVSISQTDIGNVLRNISTDHIATHNDYPSAFSGMQGVRRSEQVSVQVVNTVAETTLKTITIKGNTSRALARGGTHRRIRMSGQVAGQVSGHTATIRFDIGGTTIHTITTPSGTLSAAPFDFTWDIFNVTSTTCYSMVFGRIGTTLRQDAPAAVQTFNIANDTALDITVQWSNADVGDDWRTFMYTVEEVQ